jgi:hypothetical protein
MNCHHEPEFVDFFYCGYLRCCYCWWYGNDDANGGGGGASSGPVAHGCDGQALPNSQCLVSLLSQLSPLSWWKKLVAYGLTLVAARLCFVELLLH